MIQSFLKSWQTIFGKPNVVVRCNQFRTLYQGIQYRLFAFWDKTDKTETLVLSTHGMIKKVSKVPKAEIERAMKIRAEYFEQ
ncbi:type II toxin-antitoxin system RelE/ParE family toxin [Gelidibacter japonicus]|uniref:type II toxin-antitoxin system RelE/ParE family toxin n=1 Tax=Gelidibacter japonicus TaxID=1962232 RepID=UPI00396A8B5E